MTTLTHVRLLELLSYAPHTGVFTRRYAVGKTNVGAVFGSLNGQGYLHGWLDGRNLYKCHRLAWFYVYGHWPAGALYHKDLNKSNNRIDNLRELTKTMPFGVSKNGSGFSARITIQGTQFHLGTFKTIQGAESMFAQTRELFQ